MLSLESQKWGAGCGDPGRDSDLTVWKGEGKPLRHFYWHTVDTYCHNTKFFPLIQPTTLSHCYWVKCRWKWFSYFSLWESINPSPFLPLPIFPVQWLKQIDSTESALTQKMIDLENDKVKNQFIIWEKISKSFDYVKVVDDECSTRGLSDSTEYIMIYQLAVILCPASYIITSCCRSCSVSRRDSLRKNWTTGSRHWIRPTWYEAWSSMTCPFIETLASFCQFDRHLF